MHKIKFDDGFYPYLVDGAAIVGAPGIPMLMDLHNAQVPRQLIPFEKIRQVSSKRGYVHFYMHDRYFERVLTSTTDYLDLLKQFDGVITPDCSLLVGQSACLQQTNTYFNRAVGYYLQKHGIPVIANIRWSDEASFDYCFLGVPQKAIVAVSTHGCIRSKEQKMHFKAGLGEMIHRLNPTDVVVHGYMPDEVFGDYESATRFHRFPSQFESTHPQKGGAA